MSKTRPGASRAVSIAGLAAGVALMFGVAAAAAYVWVQGPGAERWAAWTGAPPETALEHARKHLDPTYTCPMHPQVISDSPGNCPICGMQLVPVAQAQPAREAEGEREILYYRNPMNPRMTSPVPRQDEMGMDYIPVYADEGPAGEVRISPAVRQNLGVRSAEVELQTLWRRVDTVGVVEVDETRIRQVNLRTAGWLEQLAVRAEGQPVQAGELLLALYSPELVSAQEELLQALDAGERWMVRGARERLRALGVTAEQIARLERTREPTERIEVRAPASGIVQRLNVREGMYVTPDTEVMRITDLAEVWVIAQVFGQQAGWLRTERPAEVRLPYEPGAVREARIDYLYPALEPRTRTVRVRLRLPNPEGALKPGMVADVTLFGGALREVPAIPREALIRTGREARVVIDRGEGRFASRTVEPGIEVGEWVQIRAGLEVGERVVVSGQFLLDSETSVRAGLARMEDPAPPRYEGRGVLHAVDVRARRVNLAHEPMPEIGWPAMRMDFEVARGVPLAQFAPDMPVRFFLEQREDAYVIVEMEPERGIAATGEVHAVDPERRVVNLTHPPIPDIGWPEMRMDFVVAPGVDLAPAAPGERVRFWLREAADGSYVIEALEALTPPENGR